MPLFLIGGTGFIGRHVSRRLVAAGHDVTIFHRGQTTPGLSDSVNTIHGIRDDAAALRTALEETTPDVVLDLIPYTEAQATALMETCSGRTDRIVVLSSGDVYRQYDGLDGNSDTPPR